MKVFGYIVVISMFLCSVLYFMHGELGPAGIFMILGAHEMTLQRLDRRF